MIDEVWGTLSDRWFVVLFAVAYVALGVRVLGWRRLGAYSLLAFAVAALSENMSVHVGVPFTKYAFNEALRGEELWFFDVPLFVPFSYMFVMFFSFCAGRLVAAGPFHTRPANNWVGYGLGVLFALWATWILDPMTQLGAEWYIGETFRYEGPGFWFGLPLMSQVGWLVVSAILCGILAALTWRDADDVVDSPWRNPLVPPSLVYLVQVLHLAVVGLLIGTAVPAARTLGVATFLVWVPLVTVVLVMWWQQPREIQPGKSLKE